MDGVTLLFVLLGGVCGGSYPVPIKAPEVLRAEVHPVVFQLYKSSWVFLTGLFFLIPVYMDNPQLGYQFNWWAIASAAAWIPSGVCCIAAVPRIGVATTTVANCGCAAILSFLVFWLVLGEKIKLHEINGFDFYLAPVYMCCTLIGMWALSYAPKLTVSPSTERCERRCRRRTGRIFKWVCCFCCCDRVTPVKQHEYRSSSTLEDHARDFAALVDEDGSNTPKHSTTGKPESTPSTPKSSSRKWVGQTPPTPTVSSPKPNSVSSTSGNSQSSSSRLVDPRHCQTPTSRKPSVVEDWKDRGAGLAFALFAGIFSASQYGLVNVGAKYARQQENCDAVPDKCSDTLKEAFNNFGSWMVSFGGGALLCGFVLYLGVAVVRGASGHAAPSMEFSVMFKPGSTAGLLWCLGNFFNTAAVVRGGNAIVFPQILSVQLITAGAWGLLYYEEVKGCQTWLWVISAVLTLGAIILLGMEKA